jgi:hypothetical protein
VRADEGCGDHPGEQLERAVAASRLLKISVSSDTRPRSRGSTSGSPFLLGPRGLVAIEVKNQSVTVDCDGDRWRFVRYDRYGNQVDQGELADRRGRSPSVQLNEPAGQLEEFLRSRG